MAENESAVKQKKSSASFIVGIIIVCLALAGMFFLGRLGYEKIRDLTDNSEQKQQYETFLYPVIMLDPDTFDDITKADMDDLLTSSILSLLTDSENNPYNFEFVEGTTSGLAIPQATVEEAFKKLFGSEVKPAHHSVECSTCIFEYQSASKRYVIPITGYDPAYTPKVIDLKKTREGTVELTVGYIAYNDWETDENNTFTSPEPAKYRKITLRRSDSDYYVSAIQNADISKRASNEISTTAPERTTQTTQQSTTTQAPSTTAQTTQESTTETSKTTEG